MNEPDLVARIGRHRSRFPGTHLTMILDSIVAGNTGGEFWEIPNETGESLLLLWDQGNDTFYLAGECRDETALTALMEVAEKAVGHARAEGVNRVKIRPLSPSLETHMSRLFPGLARETAGYLFYVYDPARALAKISAPPEGVSYIPIGAETLTSGTLAGSDQVRAEIRFMWSSEGRFYEEGFGVLGVRASEIVCFCTAEYVGRRFCGVGIETKPGEQRRGIATGAAARFVQEACRRGLTPCWECLGTNLPSIRVAEKTGFVLESEETYWIGYLGRVQG